MATIEDVIREFEREAGIEGAQLPPPTEVELTSTQREILTSASEHPQGRLDGRLVGPNRAQTMDASDALVLVGKGLMNQESGRLGRVEFYITDAGRQAVAPVVEAETQEQVQPTGKAKRTREALMTLQEYIDSEGIPFYYAEGFMGWVPSQHGENPILSKLEWDKLYREFVSMEESSIESARRARESPYLTYDIFDLNGGYLTTVTVQEPGNQAVVNSLVKLGYNPLLVTWQRSEAISGARSRWRTHEATPPPDELVTMLRDKGFDARERGLDVVVSLNRPISTSEVVDALGGQIDASDVRKEGDSVVITTSMEAARPITESSITINDYASQANLSRDYLDDFGAWMETVKGDDINWPRPLAEWNELSEEFDESGFPAGMYAASRPVRASASWPTSVQVEQAIQSMSVLANQQHALDSGIPSAEYSPTARDLSLLKGFLEDYAKESGSYGQSAVLTSIKQSIDTLLKSLDWPTAETPQRFVYRATFPPRGRRSIRGLAAARESIPSMHDRAKWSLTIEPHGQTPQAVAFILDIDVAEAKTILDSLVARGEAVREGGRYKLRAAGQRPIHARGRSAPSREVAGPNSMSFWDYTRYWHTMRGSRFGDWLPAGTTEARRTWEEWEALRVQFEGGQVQPRSLWWPVQESVVWTQVPGGFRADLPGGKVSLMVSREGTGPEWRYTIHIIEDGHWIDPVVSDTEFPDAESAKAAAVSSLATGFLAARSVHARGQRTQIQEQYNPNAMHVHDWMAQAKLIPDEQKRFMDWIHRLPSYYPGWVQPAGEWQKWFDQFKQTEVILAMRQSQARRQFAARSGMQENQ